MQLPIKAEHQYSFQVAGGQKYFTSQRSSKRLHLTEEEFPLAASASNRISKATDWVGLIALSFQKCSCLLFFFPIFQFIWLLHIFSSSSYYYYYECYLLLKQVVSKEPMASDPYSIINYGLGGQIEVLSK